MASLSGGIWEVDQFTNERLPPMHEALLLAKMEGEPSIKHWESRVWSDISVHDYKTLTAELALSETRLERTEAQAQQDQGSVGMLPPRLRSFCSEPRWFLWQHQEKQLQHLQQGLLLHQGPDWYFKQEVR